MKTQIDPVIAAILAALGLQFACVDRVGGDDGDPAAATGDGDGDGETSDTGKLGDMGELDESGETGEPLPESFECLDPVPIPQSGGNPSGWVQCEGGFIHREQALECDVPETPNQCGCDCSAYEYGTCTYGIEDTCECTQGCRTDADCSPGHICVCGGVLDSTSVTQCVPSNGCTTSSDCGPGLCGIGDYYFCSQYSYHAGCAGPEDSCHLDSDCAVADCPGLTTSAQYDCLPSQQGFSCQPSGECVGECGRPFFVEGTARVAPIRHREDWRAELEPRLVAEHERARIVEYWTQIGQFEHASVASFARFCLHLQQLGAPPRLLRDTQQAMVDEVRHAELAFGLASRYAGTEIGPGPLDTRSSLGAVGVLEIVDGLIREACVGETLAALEAREVAAHAEDPVVAAVLEEIAADELRHALLGWRSLRWILDQADASLRAFAISRLDAAIEALGEAVEGQGIDPTLRRHGIVDDDLRRQVRWAGTQQLIRPCAATLRGSWASQPEIRR